MKKKKDIEYMPDAFFKSHWFIPLFFVVLSFSFTNASDTYSIMNMGKGKI